MVVIKVINLARTTTAFMVTRTWVTISMQKFVLYFFIKLVENEPKRRGRKPNIPKGAKPREQPEMNLTATVIEPLLKLN